MRRILFDSCIVISLLRLPRVSFGFSNETQAVQEIASVVGTGVNPPIICGLARALSKDIDVSGLRAVPYAAPLCHRSILRGRSSLVRPWLCSLKTSFDHEAQRPL